MFVILCGGHSKILPTRENHLQRRTVKLKARCELCCQQGNNLKQHAISMGMPICKKRLGHGLWEIAEMLKCNTRYIFLLLRGLMTKMEMKDLELWAIIACLGDLECEEE